MNKKPGPLEDLVDTVKRLRGVNGCPWDAKQTTRSLRRYLVEEGGEILEAIDKDDRQNLCEELGDFLYLIVMLAEINQEADHFSLEDVISGINAKLIRRHPHVFGTSEITDEAALREQWEAIKRAEKSID